MTKKIFLIIFLAFSLIVDAQETELTIKKKNQFRFDTTRIADLSHLLAVYTNLSGKINSLDISSINTENELHIVPNGQTTVGLGFDYRWLGLSTSFSLPFMNKDDEFKGTTERFDVQINYYNNSFGIDAYLNYYKGFYLDNADDFMDWPFENFPLLQGMETFAFGISSYYFFNNKKFSYKAAFTRTQMQKKSAGSFILGAYMNRNVAIAPDGVYPVELPDSLMNNFDIDGFSNTLIGITFGYTYTWVFLKRFFINLSLAPGVGYAQPEVSTSLEDMKIEPTVSASITSRLSLGYEGKHLYMGFNLVAINHNFSYEPIEVSSTTGNLRFFIGKRFDISKLFKYTNP